MADVGITHIELEGLRAEDRGRNCSSEGCDRGKSIAEAVATFDVFKGQMEASLLSLEEIAAEMNTNAERIVTFISCTDKWSINQSWFTKRYREDS
jgi:hypothetical protein